MGSVSVILSSCRNGLSVQRLYLEGPSFLLTFLWFQETPPGEVGLGLAEGGLSQ